MWPFRKRRLDRETEAILDSCDFVLARHELSKFFALCVSEAKSQGKNVAFKSNSVEGWERLAADPRRETAARWLTDAPDYSFAILKYFSGCCPGGLFT